MSAELFAAAQLLIQERDRNFSDEEQLDRLRRLPAERWTLSAVMVDETEGMPSSTTYRSRFGSLLRAYTLIRFRPEHNFEYLRINAELRKTHSRLVEQVFSSLRAVSSTVEDPDTRLLRIHGELTANIVLARCKETAAGSFRCMYDSSQLRSRTSRSLEE